MLLSLRNEARSSQPRLMKAAMRMFAWTATRPSLYRTDRKSTRLNYSHTVIYTLSLHDALPIYAVVAQKRSEEQPAPADEGGDADVCLDGDEAVPVPHRSEEHTSELQSHRDLHSFPTRRSSDLCCCRSETKRGAASPG